MLSAALSSTAKPRERTCCGVIEEAATKAHEKRANRTKPQPWIVQKLMVAVTLGIMGYSSYVYIGRLCVPMIRKSQGAAAGRGAGIALLVVFAILLLWMLWAYVKVVMTPPGFARDYAPKMPQPLLSIPNRGMSWNSANSDMEMGPNPNTQTHHTQRSLPTSQDHLTRVDSIGGPSYEDMPVRSNSGKDYRFAAGEMRSAADVLKAVGASGDQRDPEAEDPNAGVLDALPHPLSASAGQAIPDTMTLAPTLPNRKQEQKASGGDSSAIKPRIPVFRRPPTTASLLPPHLYCAKDEIVKPYRAHHCRACATCVLKYDHHCPWIGQCVGARNQKFFLNFCQAAAVFTLYTFSTLVAYTVRAVNSLDGDIDPQKIVIIALSALFGLFTSTLVISQVRQIWVSQTAVESMQIRYMKDREADALRKAFAWWQFGAKQRTRQEWDAEWGELNTEGNIWWLGSGSKCWVDVMGTSKWGWFLPIGRSMSDGLTYPVNPRFDKQGRWRRRVDWPAELR